MKRDLGQSLYCTKAEKWQAVVDATRLMAALRRAVLIGTRSVEASEQVAALLTQAGLVHVVLNARNEPQEASLIAAAGEAGRITIATNMAGRGIDIKLSPEVARSGGLHVILTEHHESRLIDRQLFGRCRRQGDAGSYQAIISLEDHIFETHAAVLTRLCQKWRAGVAPLPARLARALTRVAQRRAERLHARIRRSTLKADSTLEKALAFASLTRS